MSLFWQFLGDKILKLIGSPVRVERLWTLALFGGSRVFKSHLFFQWCVLQSSGQRTGRHRLSASRRGANGTKNLRFHTCIQTFNRSLYEWHWISNSFLLPYMIIFSKALFFKFLLRINLVFYNYNFRLGGKSRGV